MNDRFKFRVWDKGNEQYLNLSEVDYLTLDTENGGLIIGFLDELMTEMTYMPEKDMVVEQCTGLSDKNGKLIYIGDIIKCSDGPFGTATVEYANGENFIDGIYPFNLYHDCGDECHCQLRDYPEYACEIIGNIHEQAEQKDK